jgi:hypothetical protein
MATDSISFWARHRFPQPPSARGNETTVPASSPASIAGPVEHREVVE